MRCYFRFQDIIEDYESKDHRFKIHKEIHFGPIQNGFFSGKSQFGSFGDDFPNRMFNIEGRLHTQNPKVFSSYPPAFFTLKLTEKPEKESINRIFQNFFSDPFSDPFGDMFSSFQPFGTVFTSKPRITVLKMKPVVAQPADEDNDTL